MRRRRSVPAKVMAEVIDLRDRLARRRVALYQERIAHLLDTNHRAFSRLYGTGALFTRDGTKVGRDLLLARQHLLKIVDLLDQLDDRGAVPAPRSNEGIGALYRELDELLDRTSALTHRTGHTLARMARE